MKISVIILISVNIFAKNFVYSVTEQRRDASLVRNFRRTVIGGLQYYQDMDYRKPYKKMQEPYPPEMEFFCDVKNGLSQRSKERPKSIHNLRLGDIDVVMAMGDSLTAGHGAAATNFLDIAVENRGMSWANGGEKDWRTYVTLPNLLKEYNPNLYGYSLQSSLTIHKESKFNVAEGAAESRDMLYMSKVLRKRLINDPTVDFKNDWKILTIFVGAIDFCHLICYENPEKTLKQHENDLLKAFRYIRDNIPRVFVNLVPAPALKFLQTFRRTPLCEGFIILGCPCYMKPPKTLKRVDKLIDQWQDIDFKVSQMKEFDTEEFAIVVQPFTKNLIVPKKPNGYADLEYYSYDCFHFSQKFHKTAATVLFNSMLQPVGKKPESISVDDVVECPTEERQILTTNRNSNYTNNII